MGMHHDFPGGWHHRGPLKIVGLIVGGLLLAVIFGLAFGWLVMLLWNWLMPDLFKLPVISYWQGFGLVVLGRLLFGGAGNHAPKAHGPCAPRPWHHHHWNAWNQDDESDEDARNPGGSYRNWKYYREYWREEGKAAFVAYLEKKGKLKKSE